MKFSLKEVVERDARSDEKIVEISQYLMLRVMPDQSAIVYRDNGLDTAVFTLSRDYIVAMEKATR